MYGADIDMGPGKAGSTAEKGETTKKAGQGPLWEVFTQAEDGQPHEHAGSVHAPDKELALQNARDVYSRRGKVVNIWVVRSDQIVASEAKDRPSFFEPGDDKPYRHTSFYTTPRGVKGV